jgi:hypothetical protein
MQLNEIEDRLRRARGSDHDLNEMLFAKAFGWSYPLIGAAYSHFHGLTRETEKTDFTGNSEAAMVLAHRVLEKCSFKITVNEDRSAVVNMSGQDYDASMPEVYNVTRSERSLALAISACALGIMKQMAERSAALAGAD